MTASGRYVIKFAGTRLFVSWEGNTSFAVLNTLYGVKSLLAPHDGIRSHFRISSVESDGHIYIYRGDRLLYQGCSEGEAAGRLLDCTVHYLADDCRVGPLFHTAAVSCRGRGILIPGASGSGKSTLVAWLASKGWDYLTDEIACVDQASWKIMGLYRALHFKTPIARAIESLVTPVADSSDSPSSKNVYRSRRGVIVPIEQIHSNNVYHTPQIRLIIFPQYDPNIERKLIRLSQAQASARLMGCAVNIRNLSGHGFSEISRLARQVPAYALTYGRFDHLADEISILLEHGPLTA